MSGAEISKVSKGMRKNVKSRKPTPPSLRMIENCSGFIQDRIVVYVGGRDDLIWVW
jgi:hypothetical protein